MRHRCRVGLGIALLATFLPVVPATQAYQVRALVSAGAATLAAGAGGGGMTLRATLGQPMVGRASSPQYGGTSGYWPGGGTVTVSIEPPPEGQDVQPGRIEFAAPSPNPSPGAVAFRIALPHAAHVRVLVLDIQGRLVARIDQGTLAAGRYRIDWDGRGLAGGVYLTQLQVDGSMAATRRWVLIR
jgi:FlgD Ig-like domain